MTGFSLLLLMAGGITGQASGREPLTLKGHTGWVGAVAFAPNGKTLASASADGTIKWWDPVKGELLQTWKGPGEPLCALAFSPDGKTVASGGYDRIVRLWDVTDPGKPLSLSGHKGLVTSVAFSPDGKILASGSIDGTVRLWEAAGGRRGLILRRHTSWVNGVSFARDGSLASGGSDNVANVWIGRGASWKLRAAAEAREGEIRSVALAPDGKTLAVGTRYGTVRVWDIARGKPLAVLKGHPGDVWAVAFSPDGRTLASGAGDWDRPGEVRLWDTRDWSRRGLLRHSGEVLCVAFSPDSRRLAAGSWDRTIRVWDLGPPPDGKKPRIEDRGSRIEGQGEQCGRFCRSRSSILDSRFSEVLHLPR
jgi:WD40 repeat protein